MIQGKRTVVKFHQQKHQQLENTEIRDPEPERELVLELRSMRGAPAMDAGPDTEVAETGGGERAACEYFTRVSPRQRAGQREGEHGSHGGEHGHAAAEASGAPRPHSGCGAPAVAMETHGPGRQQLADRDPSPRRGLSPAERRAQPAPASGLAGRSRPYLRPPGGGRGDDGRTPARPKSLLGGHRS